MIENKMKNKIRKIIISLFFALLMISCSEPNPTELVLLNTADQDDVEIQLFSENPEELVSDVNYDSTGVAIPGFKHSSSIVINAIINSHLEKNSGLYFAQAVFFDKNSKVNRNDGSLIGYKTRLVGRVYFGNEQARLNEFVVRYYENRIPKDTSLGPSHLLKKIFPQRKFVDEFPYDSYIKFRVEPIIGEAFEKSFLTPKIIMGKVVYRKASNENKYNYRIYWEGTDKGKIEIVIGAFKDFIRKNDPIVKMITQDDGSFFIPQSIIDRIYSVANDKIVISLIRKNTFENTSNTEINDYQIITQSTHNITIDLPK